MDSLINKISLREILKSFLPAFYIVVFLIPISEKTELFKSINAYYPDIYNILFLIIFTALFGILISAIDLPKHFCLFSRILPTEKLKKEMDNINTIDVDNSYFKFYDEDISSDNKGITEKYTNYYHFCFNMAIASFLLLLLYLIFDNNSFCDSYAFPIAIILFISIIGVLFLLYGKRKIKYRFDRYLKKYKSSKYYNNLSK